MWILMWTHLFPVYFFPACIQFSVKLTVPGNLCLPVGTCTVEVIASEFLSRWRKKGFTWVSQRMRTTLLLLSVISKRNWTKWDRCSDDMDSVFPHENMDIKITCKTTSCCCLSDRNWNAKQGVTGTGQQVPVTEQNHVKNIIRLFWGAKSNGRLKCTYK